MDYFTKLGMLLLIVYALRALLFAKGSKPSPTIALHSALFLAYYAFVEFVIVDRTRFPGPVSVSLWYEPVAFLTIPAIGTIMDIRSTQRNWCRFAVRCAIELCIAPLWWNALAHLIVYIGCVDI